MEKVKTRDDSITFYNEAYGETYHSTSVGAIEEAVKKYVEPANIRAGMTVLDFCFGLGYNTLAALAKTHELRIIAVELDQGILEKIQETEVPEQYQEDYEKIKVAARESYYYDEKTVIKLFKGEASGIFTFIKEPIDRVLFDPFSPKKNPELWTLDVFQKLFEKMSSGGRLTTFSCARHVRDNLKAAGFRVEDGPILGRKSPSTVAIKD
ncbi:MAG: tRNA (5-methylaminomethyl-2-thiouridine)(34)-methyltransferase MnmD [Candidatus Woesearchaeota archaeon]